jgi:protease-4
MSALQAPPRRSRSPRPSAAAGSSPSSPSWRSRSSRSWAWRSARASSTPSNRSAAPSRRARRCRRTPSPPSPSTAPIGYDGTSSSPEGLKTLLDQAENDSNIKAVVLRVNSGGGTATAGEEMAAYVRDFSKPVVVSSASMNASAAYEISSQADCIFVNQTTEIGAIGTIMTTADLSGLLNKLGISTDSIASADSKDSSYGLRPLTDDERAYYQQMVDEINQTFLDNVASGRHLTSDQVNELATGMPFTGTTAVTNGIADAIGTREDAERKAADLAGIDDYNSYSLALPSSELDNLTSLLSEDKLSVSDVEKVLKQYESEGSDVR